MIWWRRRPPVEVFYVTVMMFMVGFIVAIIGAAYLFSREVTRGPINCVTVGSFTYCDGAQ